MVATCLRHAVFMLFLSINIMSGAFSAPSTVDDDDVWMPNLRGLPIGREGEIVAEFEVRTQNPILFRV